MSARSILSLASVGVSAIFLAGCVQPADQNVQFASDSGLKVEAGIPCGHVAANVRASVPGCEGYLSFAGPEATEEQVLDLNVRFLNEVQVVVNFDFDQAVLRPDARAILDAQAEWMKQYSGLRFSVFGHTDLTGSLDYNFDLAKRRADAVIAYLLARGIPTEQLEAVVSFGKTKPLIDRPNPEERNRRTVTEVTGYLRVAAYTTAPIACAFVEPMYLPTYPWCIVQLDVALPPVTPPSVPVTVDASYPRPQDTDYDGNLSGQAAITYNADGSILREAEGTTGPSGSDPRTFTSVSSNQQPNGAVGNLSATVTTASGQVISASRTVNTDGTATYQGGNQSETY